MIKNLYYKPRQKIKKILSLNNEKKEIYGRQVYVAFPVKQENYLFTNQATGWISPIKFNQAIQINKPNINIKTTFNNNEKQIKNHDFLRYNIEIGKLWIPLTKLLINYIKFCDYQISKCNQKSKNVSNLNIKDDWNQKKEFLKELYNSWIQLINKINNKNQSNFKETRSLLFRTGKIIFQLTENGLENNRLINPKHSIIVAWIGGCLALASISSYTHAIVKNNEHLYDLNNLNNLINKVNEYSLKFVNLLKNKSFLISHHVKKALIDAKNELEILKLEPYFLEAIQDYFSKSNSVKALLILNETDEIIKLGLKLIDCKKSEIKYFVKS